MRRFRSGIQVIARMVLMLGAVGATHAALGQGTVVGWGSNSFGEATPPEGLRDVVSVSAGFEHSMALENDGTIQEWGYSGGFPCLRPIDAPRAATPLLRATAIADGGFHRLAVKTDDTVAGWGDNCFGQASPPQGLIGVKWVAAGYLHSLALRFDGTVVGWGENSHGQATPPAGLEGVSAIAAGHSHSLALKSDGTVVGWGDNAYGQATPPAGLSGVAAIAAGGFHSLALKNDGTVVGWGDNSSGQAAPPAGLAGVKVIAAGESHSLAAKSDGTLTAWGSNLCGQATPPAGLTGVKAVAAGDCHSLAVVGSPCRVDIRLSYSPATATLTMYHTLGTTEASNLFQSWLISAHGATLLVRRQTPPIDPPHTFVNSIPLVSMGQIGVLGTLHSLDDLFMCYDFATADTGGAGPTVAELEEILRQSGVASLPR